MCQCCWLRLENFGKRSCPGCRRDLNEDDPLIESLQVPVRTLYRFQVEADDDTGVGYNLLLMLDVISYFRTSIPIPSSLFTRTFHLTDVPPVIQAMLDNGFVTKGDLEGRPGILIDSETQGLVQRCLSSPAGLRLAVTMIQTEFGFLACRRDNKVVELTLPHALSIWEHIVTNPELIKRYLAFSATILFALDGNGNGHAALDFSTSSLVHIRKCYPEDAVEVTTGIYHRAFTLMKVYKFQEAFSLLRKLPSTFGTTSGWQNGRLVTTLFKAEGCLAYCLYELGHPAESLVMSDVLLERIQEATANEIVADYESCHIISTFKFRRAKTLIRLGLDVEAMAQLKDTLRSNVRYYSHQSPKTMATKKQIAKLLMRKGNFEEAVQLYGQIQCVEKVIWPENHPQKLVTVAGIVSALRQMGNCEKAFKLCETTLTEVRELECPDNAIEILMLKRELAWTLVGKKRFSVAKALLHEVLERMLGILGERHPFIEPAIGDIQALQSY